MLPDPITGIPSRSRQLSLWPEPITGFPASDATVGHAPGAPSACRPVPSGEGLPKLREVGLQAGEEVTHIFRPADGLAAELPVYGDVLVLTNERLIAFCQSNSSRETYLVPTSEMKHAVVKAGARNPSTLVQGVLMVVAGLLGYLIVGYWLASQLDGPTIPVLNMDLAPLIALLITLAGLGLIVQVYFTRPNGIVTFQGDGLQFSFPFRGQMAETQIYELVNAAFAARRQRSPHEAEDEEGATDQAPLT